MTSAISQKNQKRVFFWKIFGEHNTTTKLATEMSELTMFGTKKTKNKTGEDNSTSKIAIDNGSTEVIQRSWIFNESVLVPRGRIIFVKRSEGAQILVLNLP